MSDWMDTCLILFIINKLSGFTITSKQLIAIFEIYHKSAESIIWETQLKNTEQGMHISLSPTSLSIPPAFLEQSSFQNSTLPRGV